MRINMVDVSLLSDVHLRAEYREILMMDNYYRRSKNTARGIVDSELPQTYTLNKGHAKFFYDKWGYVTSRLNELTVEMTIRGFKTREHDGFNLTMVSPQHFKDYLPTQEDLDINIERILIRIKQKYDEGKDWFYKYYGKDMTFNDWRKIYGK